MYTQIKNFFHIRFLMNIYSIRNMITGNGAVWLKLNTQDLENMVETTVSRLSLDLEEFSELEVFGNGKYDPDQTTVLLTKITV